MSENNKNVDFNDEKEPIESMPGEYRYSLNAGIEFAKQLEEKGLKSIIVFGVPLPESKDEVASPDYSSTGIVQRAIRELKKQTDLVVIGDVCLCQYTSHGHCGLIKENDDTDDGVEILNDESLEYLAKVAVSYAKAGVDIVAPSDMMDGRVDVIRTALDENGFYILIGKESILDELREIGFTIKNEGFYTVCYKE